MLSLLLDFVKVFFTNFDSSLIITALSDLQKVVFLAPSVCGFLVFVSDVSGTAERICAKFAWKARLDEFEGKGQRQNTPGTRNGIVRPFWRLRAVCVWQNIFSF